MANPNVNIFSLARRIGRPLILDGAMGSMLQQEHDSKDALWMSYLNVDRPEEVLKIHNDYLAAGADIITTNTFRTNPAALKEYPDYSSKELVTKAIEIAKISVNNDSILIAGSNPPGEDCYQVERKLSHKKLKKNHHKHIKNLYDNGVHLILNETQSHFDEIKIICEFCSSENIPFIISLYFDENLKILSGEKLKDVIKFISKYNPMAIGFNCIKPEIFLKFFEQSKFYYNWGVYCNCGASEVSEKAMVCSISSEEYGRFINQILVKSPSFIGSCCGSSPEHTNEIKKILDAGNYD